ncbi:MAG: hypothetical protein K2L59_04360 [Muribaculaceae bacterium]|nr:hypothetical protein [Muribaculaceae bacterium]
MIKTAVQTERHSERPTAERILVAALCLLLLFPAGYLSPVCRAAVTTVDPVSETPSDPVPAETGQPPLSPDSTVYLEAGIAVADTRLPADSIPPTEVRADDYAYDENGKIPFNPSPTRAVWLSALCPGLGQIYNRRYWKLPIVIGGFMGLGYATNWNNSQYQDYMQGYRDLLDNDPQTKSYMDFFPPTVNEDDLDKTWLEQTFKSRKDYARRNRDLCIIGLVALYALCMLDAYVDASLTHFDVSPDLSLDWSPTLLEQPAAKGRPALGINWAFTF